MSEDVRWTRLAFPTPALSGSGSEGLFSASWGEAPLAMIFGGPLGPRKKLP